MGDDLVLPDGVEPDRAVVEGEGHKTDAIILLGDGGVVATQEENDDSSTGSCENLEMDVTRPVTAPSAHQVASDPEPGNELLVAFEKFLGN